jgi:hypothetical protein
MAWGDDDQGSGPGIARRGFGSGALSQVLPVTIHAPRGTSTIPGRDMDIYNKMAMGIQGMNQLASDMNGLDSIGPETRDIIRKLRMLAVELQGELERRVTG